jgi:sugar O-acyltransferase (sialic acid O-acetyltransferase NeuD family)
VPVLGILGVGIPRETYLERYGLLMDLSLKTTDMIFWGATGQSRVLRECMESSGLRLVALFDNNNALTSPFPDVPLYFGRGGFEDWISRRNSSAAVAFLVAIGGEKGKDRVEIQQYLESHGLSPIVARHPTAFIADDVVIGLGSQILAHASVCVKTVVGCGCIINTGAIVDHECILGDGVHICPGANLAGCVEVGKCSTVYTGAVVLPRVKIGESSIVGAGAVVLQDVPPYTVVAGNPAKILRKVI